MNIYICYTVFHLYTSLLKIYNDDPNKECIIILTDHMNFKEKEIKRLKQKINGKVYFVEDLKMREKILGEKKNIFMYRRKVLKVFEKQNKNLVLNIFNRKIDKIYTFLDSNITAHYFIYKFKKITLIEDGILIYTFKRNLKDLLTYIFNLPKRGGRDKRIVSIEASRLGELPKKLKEKAVKLSINKLESKLSSKEVQEVQYIFNINFCYDYENTVLILTQPLYKYYISKKEQYYFYNFIIKKYLNEGKKVLQKKHPMDNLLYLEKNIELIKSEIPIELFNLEKQKKLEEVFSVNSSAAYNLKNVKNVKNLGFSLDKNLIKKMKKYMEEIDEKN